MPRSKTSATPPLRSGDATLFGPWRWRSNQLESGDAPASTVSVNQKSSHKKTGTLSSPGRQHSRGLDRIHGRDPGLESAPHSTTDVGELIA
jgi:hypothetical protein